MNPKAFDDVEDTDQPVPSVLTVYIPNELWYAGRDVAYRRGRMPVSVFIRKGLISRMASGVDDVSA